MTSLPLTAEQETILGKLGVTYEQFVFYQTGRINGRYLTHAVTTLLIYDYLLTLGDEIEYVWKTVPRISVAKTFWTLNRYWPILSMIIRIWAMAYVLPSGLACSFALQFTAWSGMFNIAIVDILLMLRVWALYNGSKKIGIFLIAVFLIGLPTAIAIRKVPPPASLPLVTSAPQTLTGCRRSPPSELFSLYAMALAIETVIFAMVILKAWGTQFRSQTPVLTTLVRDGAIYYAAIFAILVVMITATMVPVMYQPIADSTINIPLCSLACSRMILSLRGLYFKAGDDGRIPTSTAGGNITDGRPQFAPNFVPPLDTYREEEIVLDEIHSPQSSIPFKRNPNEDEEWYIERETGSPASPISPSSPRWEVSRRWRGRSSDVGIRNVVSPILANVTVTRSRSVLGDDGQPVEDHSPGHRTQHSLQRKKSEGWDPDLDDVDPQYVARAY